MSELQLFDSLDPATEAALRASIKRFGVLAPIHVSIGPWKAGAVVDGHHRSRLAREVGVHCPRVELAVRDEEHAKALQRTLNEDRRHLDPDQRREIVAELRQEGHSLRAIGGALGVSKSQVANDLHALSSGGQWSEPERIRTSDGRTYPAQRPEPSPDPAEDGEPLFAPGEIEAIHGTVTDDLTEQYGDDIPNDVLDAALDEAIAGNLESKKLPEPPTEWKSTKPDVGGGVSHPARFSPELVLVFAELLRTYSQSGARVLDPFAGTGRIHQLYPEFETFGIEIEPEWANLHDRTQLGSAVCLPFYPEMFDAVVTSPTYGNRLADSHDAADPERRRSYTHDLGRPLHDDNSGDLHWRNGYRGSEHYRIFHERAWCEAIGTLKIGGIFIINIKDHWRDGRLQLVPDWHCWCLGRLGLDYVDSRTVGTRNLRQGANGELRSTEEVYVFRKTGMPHDVISHWTPS